MLSKYSHWSHVPSQRDGMFDLHADPGGKCPPEYEDHDEKPKNAKRI